MKVTINIAVLALIGEISAVQIERHYYNQHLAQNRWAPGKFYPPTEKGRKWFELDDSDERL